MVIKERNVLFNDALNTFYLGLYGDGHNVEDHPDSERKPAAAKWVLFIFIIPQTGYKPE